MRVRLSAFPKCYLEDIAGSRTMTLFDWIAMARQLDADGLEMYEGFFTSPEPAYQDTVGEAIQSAGFEMPMLCCSPDFTQRDADGRKRAVEHEARMIAVTRHLGGPKKVRKESLVQESSGVENRVRRTHQRAQAPPWPKSLPVSRRRRYEAVGWVRGDRRQPNQHRERIGSEPCVSATAVPPRSCGSEGGRSSAQHDSNNLERATEPIYFATESS